MLQIIKLVIYDTYSRFFFIFLTYYRLTFSRILIVVIYNQNKLIISNIFLSVPNNIYFKSNHIY